MNGWQGKILRVNLTTGECKPEEFPSRRAKEFLGGRGLGTQYLLQEIDPRVDPLSPANKLILATGPLTGTAAPTGGRYMALTKSPLSGTIACSNSGGHFGPALKYAGFDLVILEGKAPRPVYLWLHDQKAELRAADHLWGRNTHKTENKILSETHLEAKVASVGPAGEKLVKFACIINDKHRAAGRSGVGAVMGSKNLKAVAAHGTEGIQVADAEAFKAAYLQALDKIKKDPTTSQALPLYGTDCLMNIINASGLLPTRNFQGGVFERAYDLSGEAMAEKILVRNRACFACPIACGRVTAVKAGPFKGRGEGPEYENAWALGADCGIGDLEAVARVNWLCNEEGMDPISLGGTIACAMELFQRGVLSREQAGGELAFGDGEALLRLAKMTAAREGLGDLLAEGAKKLAQHFGRPELFMGVKGMEFPAYDGRGAQGMGLGYATNNRGADHLRGYTISPEILGSPQKLDPLSTQDKAGWLKGFQDFTAIVDSVGLCLFTTFALGPKDVLAFFNSVTGLGLSPEEFSLAGERIWNLERLFNLRAGFGMQDDTLPSRLLEEPLPSGPAQGSVVRLKAMLPEYYRLRGWDEEGVPRKDKLKELGLE